MVTKHCRIDLFDAGGLNLAKIHMVTKRAEEPK